jgi:DMSO/TMAO reductase YedYZ molybdopterin-dependent catalytic subunit
MSGAAVDRLLAVLLVALLATGLLTLRAGAPPNGWLFVLHGLLGGALLAMLLVKLAGSLPKAAAGRRWERLSLAVPLALLALGSVLGGFGWAAAGRFVLVGPVSLLTLHVLLGFALLPLLLVHLWPRRWRLLRPGSARPVAMHRLISRRSLLTAGALALASGATWSTAQLIDGLRAGRRRFTGSRWLPAGGIPPSTTFFGEPVPTIDPAAWRLTVGGRVDRPATYSLADLAALGETDLAAVLDCTGGWAMETSWIGVPLSLLLDLARPTPGAGRVEIRSVTGWGALLPIDEARRAFLATGVAGSPLPVANGAPCRLVAPDRRGLDWVKWVERIEVG